MKYLVQELEIIEKEHKEFFEKNNLKLFQYISLSKKPVMLWFNKDMQDTYKLPKDAFEKINDLIMSYYSLK